MYKSILQIHLQVMRFQTKLIHFYNLESMIANKHDKMVAMEMVSMEDPPLMMRPSFSDGCGSFVSV